MSADLSARNYYSKGIYSITCPSSRKIDGPPAGTYWRVAPEKFAELDADNRIWWGPHGDGQPRLKRFLSEVKAGKVPQTLWKYQEVGHTQEAKKELLELVTFESPDTVFDTPKPTRLIQRMLRLATAPDEGSLVLDFFAGSGATGDAVMRLNREDGGDRRFIMVQLPEPTGDSGMPTIASMVRMRTVAAAERLRSAPGELMDSTRPDLGFRAFRLSTSNFSVWDPSAKDPEEMVEQLELAAANHVSADATEGSMLTELLLKAGYPLTSPAVSQRFGGVAGYSIDEGALFVCLAPELTIGAFEAMAERDPAMILVLDSGFGGSDELKVNALQTVRARNQRSGSDITLRVV
jgi:adenine-specific DNA-methyltransferase